MQEERLNVGLYACPACPSVYRLYEVEAFGGSSPSLPRVQFLVAQTPTDVWCLNSFIRHRFRRFYSFAPLTLIPMQKKLLDHTLLTSKELDWLDDYHNTVSGATGAP